MKPSLEENNINNSKMNNSINKSINNNNSFISKDSNKISLNNMLSESNTEFNLEEYKNKDLRCLNCYLIPFLSLNSPSNLIDINCNYGHTTKINLEEYLQCGFNNNFINLSCCKCKTQILKNEKIFKYCKECSELLCENCIIKHNNMYEDHHTVNLDKYDTTCILHNETFDYFCLDCKKNICQYCSDDFHNEHKLVDLDDINLKRKEFKNIKENFIKERDNYLNIPNILNELINKLKQELDKKMNDIKNQIKFKESIINTYENKVDNYNAIINLKNLNFNLKPFNIDKNITIIDNIINLLKYANMNEIKLNNNKNKNDNLKKTNNNKIIKTKKDKNLKNNNKINNEIKNNKVEKNEKENEKKNNEEKKENNINTFKKFNNVYKKNFISNKKMNENFSNLNKQNKENNENKTNNNMSVQIINNELNEIDDNYKNIFSNSLEKNKNIKRNNLEDNINNKKEKYINQNNINFNNKLISRSTKNLNYIKTEQQNLSSNPKTKLEIEDNREIKNSSQSQKAQNLNDNEPLTLIRKFNNNELIENKELEKRDLSNVKNNINKKKDNKIMNKIKNIKINQNNKKIEKDKLTISSDEEEEEEEEEDDDNYDSNEEEESEQENEEESEEEDEKDNKNNKQILKSDKKNEKSDKKKINQISNDKEFEKELDEEINDNININKYINNEENDTSFRHQKIYPKSNISFENINISDIFSNKKKNINKNLSSFKDKKKVNIINKVNNNQKLIKDKKVSEFRPKCSNLKIKETNNTVCCMIEIEEDIFACGFLLGEIDIYNVNYLNCLLTILEHKSRINNMFLLKDKSILTSSFDYTMKKIRINDDNSYTLEYTFKSFKNIVYKGIELNNFDIVSISFRGNINIFKRENVNNYINYRQHEIADEEIYNVIELFPNKEIAISTDECLRFFSMDTYKNIDNVHLLEFRKGNNMILINKNILIVLLKHDIGLVDIEQRQVIFKCSLGNIGKAECICYLQDNTLLVGVSNNKCDKIQFLFKQYNIKMNKLKLIAEKLEEVDKKENDDYSRITSIVELKNKIIVYGTAGFEEFKLVGNISIID